MTQTACVFDRALVRRHLDRARPGFAKHSALFDDTSAQLTERLGEIRRPFANALDLSPYPFLEKHRIVPNADSLICEEENLSFAPDTFDLIASNLGMQWVNDLPDTLAKIHTILRPDGLFLSALIGGRSLFELRECLTEAEMTVSGGLSPRFSPNLDLRTAGDLMRRAGFHLPVVDIETVTLMYKDAFDLMRDLRGMGQTNAHSQRLRHPTRRAVFDEADRLYRQRFGTSDGTVPASFEIVYLHGWK
ncbi:MAG: methyltransferase domain-containing protein [Alphaproteobacteria bacterium]|nr:methyltransferase domain-containing protein [Alphaproteobacteria bacterium]